MSGRVLFVGESFRRTEIYGSGRWHRTTRIFMLVVNLICSMLVESFKHSKNQESSDFVQQTPMLMVGGECVRVHVQIGTHRTSLAELLKGDG